METKRCPSCGDTKSVTDYWRCKSTKDGLQTSCKPCHKVWNAVWRWDNKEKLQAERRARYIRDWAKERAEYKTWRLNNPKKYRDAVDRWNANNPERRVRNVREWQAKNPTKAKIISRRATTNRRARKINALGFIERIDPQLVYVRDGGICQICQKPVDANNFHVDHIKPLAKGGEHSLANVQLAHPKCNLSKGTKYGRAA